MKIKIIPSAPREYNFRRPDPAAPKSLHVQHRRSKRSPKQRHAQSFGVRVGYWPCLGGPFLAIDVASHRWDLWYGRPSYAGDSRTSIPSQAARGGSLPPSQPGGRPIIMNIIHDAPPPLFDRATVRRDLDRALVATARRRAMGI